MNKTRKKNEQMAYKRNAVCSGVLASLRLPRCQSALFCHFKYESSHVINYLIRKMRLSAELRFL